MGQQTIIVGRDNEMRQLNQLLAETERNLGKMVFVSGESGAGKTHLVRQFLSRLGNNHLTAIEACVDIEGTNPFSPVKHLLAELQSRAAAETPVQRKKNFESLKAILKDAGPDWIALIPFIGPVASAGITTINAARRELGHPLKASDVNGPDEIHKTFDDQLRRLAKKKPVIIFLDDLQWTDPSTLNLLFALGRSLREKPFPLLFIGTYRCHELIPGPGNEWMRHRSQIFSRILNELINYTRQEFHIPRRDQWFVEMDVPAFRRGDIKDFIDTKYPGNRFPGDFAARLEGITEGNPLFVTGILEFLEQGGYMTGSQRGGYKLRAKVLKELPQTIEVVIKNRLGFLDRGIRKILDYASVNGENFALQVIERMLEMEAAELASRLGELCRTYDLLMPDADRMDTIGNKFLDFYCFRHTLVHKYVYECLDINQKRILHRKVAEILMDLYGDELTRQREVKELVDRHIQIGSGLIDCYTLQLTNEKVNMEDCAEVQRLLEAAGDEAKAAEQRFEQYAWNECLERAGKALAFLNKLTALTPGAEEIKFKALYWKSKAQGQLGNYEPAKESAEELLVTARNQNSKKNTAAALERLGREYENSGNYDQSIAYYRQALEMAGNEAEIYTNLGWVTRLKENYDQALDYFKQALAIGKKANDGKNIGKSYIGIGTVLDLRGDYDGALEYYYWALEISKSLSDRVMMAGSYNNIGIALESKGQYDEAIEYHQKALETRESMNDRVNIAVSCNNIGNLLYSRGDYDGAIEYHQKALETRECLMDRPGMVNGYIGIGNALSKKRDYDGALEYHDKALKISKDLDDRVKMALIYYALGMTMNAKENDDGALAYYEKALPIYKQLENGEMVKRLNELIWESKKKSIKRRK